MAFTIMTNNRYASGQLVSGQVKVQGFDVAFKSPEPSVASIFNDYIQNLSYDAVDLPLANYIIARDLGKPLAGIPVFPTRFFPQFGTMVNRKAGIKSVNDLAGKRVGISGFAFNPATWLRSIFLHQYDLPFEQVTWVEGEPNSLSNVPYGRSRRFKIEKGGNLMQQLDSGELDAVMMADGGLEPTDKIDRLFQDPWAEIRKFYDATGVFPINATLTIKEDVLEAHPGVDQALVAAYQEAWDRYVAETGEGEHMALSLSELKKMGLFPPKQGFSANRKALAWMIHACYEQGLIKKLWEPEELWPQIG